MIVESTVFVVDEDPAVCRSLADLMDAVRLPAETFGSAQEFLDSYDPERPGCLLLDIRMPGIGGLQLQETLAERDISIPTIILTGHGDVAMVTHTMKRGAFDFIEKPFRADALLQRVQEAIDLDLRLRKERKHREEVAARLARLSARELEVLEHVASGMPNKAIGVALGVSMKTIEVHRSNAMRKLRVGSVAELVRFKVEAEECVENSRSIPAAGLTPRSLDVPHSVPQTLP